MKNPLELRPAGVSCQVISGTLLLLAILPHAANLDPLIMLFCAGVIGLKLLLVLKQPQRKTRYLVLAASLAGFTLSAWIYGLPVGRDPGVSFLMVLTGLKVLEARTIRDTRVIVLLGYFAVVTHFLYSTDAPVVLYLFGLVVLMTCQIIRLGRVTPGLDVRSDFRLTLKLMLQAVPFALVMFFLFPRMAGSLWLFQTDSGQATTGLSDTLVMGTISGLVESDETAFTAAFENARVPPESARYWRSGILWLTDGRKWTRGPDLPSRPVTIRYDSTGRFSYEITPADSSGEWFHALDLPVSAPDGLTLTADIVLRPAVQRGNPQRYRVESATGSANRSMDTAQALRGLQIPPDSITPRLQSLVESIQAQLPGADTLNATAFAGRMLGYLNENEFFYTLRPPVLLSNTPVDEFLFETRSGFCEHYATSFVTVMRAAGYPARIVIGYLGGELNPLTDEITVLQSDAHAWAEYWDNSLGWVRVDPTAAVAPQRIEQSINYDLSISDNGVVRYLPLELGMARSLLRDLRWYAGLAKQQWRRWFVDFDQARQRQLMDALGLDGASRLIPVIAILASLSMLVATACVLFRIDRDRPDPVQRIYRSYCRKLERLGISRRDWEGPVDYCWRASGRLPDCTDALFAITRLYTDLRYGPNPRSQRIRRFRRAVHALKIDTPAERQGGS